MLKDFKNKESVLLYNKRELILMGYPDNDDLDDFLNLLAGKIITIDLEKSIPYAGIYVSVEYPEHAIYSVLIKRTVYQDPEIARGELLSYPAIAYALDMKTHQARLLCNDIMKKIKRMTLLDDYSDHEFYNSLQSNY